MKHLLIMWQQHAGAQCCSSSSSSKGAHGRRDVHRLKSDHRDIQPMPESKVHSTFPRGRFGIIDYRSFWLVAFFDTSLGSFSVIASFLINQLTPECVKWPPDTLKIYKNALNLSCPIVEQAVYAFRGENRALCWALGRCLFYVAVASPSEIDIL